MRNDEIQINLDGPNEEIDPRAVADAIVAVDKILRHISAEAPLLPTLSLLEIGSAKVAIRADESRVSRMRSGIERLTASAGVPACWDAEGVAALVELERVNTRRGVQAVALQTNQTVIAIDEQLARNARASIAPPAPSLGTAQGKLYRYLNDDLGRRRSAALRDYRTGGVIEIHFPDHLKAEVRSLLDHEVEVWGEVQRDAVDHIQSVSIVGINPVGKSRAAVTLDEVAGILGPNWTDGLGSVEWVRRQRD